MDRVHPAHLSRHARRRDRGEAQGRRRRGHRGDRPAGFGGLALARSMNAAMSARRGGIVLADISGYTEFIAATELEHSREILAELLEQITFSVKHAVSVA